ncbi:MAG: hypothetical protein P1T08_05545 [Acidimicrobiia bacterium]|nr:hypothetical protein [Acidimicrobiia bacterium]
MVGLVAVGLAIMPVLVGRSGPAPVALGVIGITLGVGGSVAGRVALLAMSATVFLVEVAVALDPSEGAAWWTVGWAALLFVFLDAGAGLVERRDRLPGALGRQAPRMFGLAVGVAVVAALVLTAAQAPLERGLLVQAAGLGAAATLLLTVGVLAREDRGEGR